MFCAHTVFVKMQLAQLWIVLTCPVLYKSITHILQRINKQIIMHYEKKEAKQ